MRLYGPHFHCEWGWGGPSLLMLSLMWFVASPSLPTLTSIVIVDMTWAWCYYAQWAPSLSMQLTVVNSVNASQLLSFILGIEISSHFNVYSRSICYSVLCRHKIVVIQLAYIFQVLYCSIVKNPIIDLNLIYLMSSLDVKIKVDYVNLQKTCRWI